MNVNNIEIERRWLVKSCPLEGYVDGTKIVQGYMVIGNDGSARIRHSSCYKDNGQEYEEFMLCVKKGKGLVRIEVETRITSCQFNDMWITTKGARIEKTRYNIVLSESLVAEYDIFYGDLTSLQMVEVEFKSIADAENFNAPTWFGIEVTDDSRYTNMSLALNGLKHLDFK